MKEFMYLRSELRLLLMAIAMAAQNANRSDEYMEGFSDALLAVAVAVGVEEMPRQRTVIVDTANNAAGKLQGQ